MIFKELIILNMILRRLRYFTTHLVPHQHTVNKIVQTTNLINRTSSVTLGPNGRLVAIQSQVHLPRITKDGVTVIKSIQFEDRLMNAIATLIKKAANSANKYSGDGTTTTTLLAFELIRVAHKWSGFEANQKQFREGLQKGKNIAIEFLQELSMKVSTQQKLKQVAMIATNGDEELSELVSEAIFKSESVKIEKSKSTSSKLEFTSGLKITRGIPHQMLVNKINKIQFNYPAVLVFNGNIKEVKEILPAIEKAKAMKKPLVVFAEDISESVSSMLYYNHLKGIIESCPIRVPQRGSNSSSYIPTLSSITNAYLFSPFSETKLRDIGFHHFGKCIKITVDEFETTVVSASTTQSKSCTIMIGGNSETEILEKYDKAVDALNSVEGAKKHGIVPGGGMSYFRAAELLDQYSKLDENETHTLALRVLAETLRQPFKTLLRLSEIDYVKETKGWQGINIVTKQYGDMFQQGIIDSLLVSKNCIIDSVSVSSMLLSLQLAIINDTKYKESDYDVYQGRHLL